MRIAEVFHSIQGEGLFTGTPSVFVRTTGCNLRCWFCDTPYTSWQPEGATRHWSDVVDQVLRYECEHVVLTGGEPLLQRDVEPFTRSLVERGCCITIESAGTVFRPVAAQLMSISPKLSNSTPPESRNARWSARHEAHREQLDVVARLITEYPYQLKFVVDRPADLDEIEQYLACLPGVDRDRVYLMPQAITRDDLATKSAWLRPAAAQRGVQFSNRLHIELFGNTRGT